jgi:hypothetical protein
LVKLKRLTCKSNKVTCLRPLQELTMLIEIDLEANPIKSLDTVLQTIVTKKDLLVFNLKQSPLAKENPSDLFASASASDSTQILEEAKALMAMSKPSTVSAASQGSARRAAQVHRQPSRNNYCRSVFSRQQVPTPPVLFQLPVISSTRHCT